MNETEHNKTLSRCGVSANNLGALTALALSLCLFACGHPPKAPENATRIAVAEPSKPSLAEVCKQSKFEDSQLRYYDCSPKCDSLESFVGNRRRQESDSCNTKLWCMSEGFDVRRNGLHVSDYAPLANECVEAMQALFTSINTAQEVTSEEETCVNKLLEPDAKDATDGIRPSEDDQQYAERKATGQSRLATWRQVFEGRADLAAVRRFLKDRKLLGSWDDYGSDYGAPFAPPCRIAFARGMAKSIAAWKRPVEERRAKERAEKAEWESGRVQRERDAVLGRRFVPIENACVKEGTLAAARCEQLEGLAPEEVTKCRNACDRAIEQARLAGLAAEAEAKRVAERAAREEQAKREAAAHDAAAAQAAAAAAAKKKTDDIAACEATCLKQKKSEAVCKRICAQ
jgi:hypothetical protein